MIVFLILATCALEEMRKGRQVGLVRVFPHQTPFKGFVLHPSQFPAVSIRSFLCLVSQVNGMFAFVLYDSDKDVYIAARDPIGIIPLYYGQAPVCLPGKFPSGGRRFCGGSNLWKTSSIFKGLFFGLYSSDGETLYSVCVKRQEEGSTPPLSFQPHLKLGRNPPKATKRYLLDLRGLPAWTVTLDFTLDFRMHGLNVLNEEGGMMEAMAAMGLFGSPAR